MTDSPRKEAMAHALGYFVDEDGKVYNPKGVQLKVSSKNNKKYPQINVKIGDRKFTIRMHRLAAYCFYGDDIYKKGIVVRHLDDNKTNISKSNIALGTQRDNMQDMSKEMLAISSEKKRKYAIENNVKPPRTVKIEDKDIPKILDMLDRGESQRSIAKCYDVHHSTIGYIHKNRRFTYENN